MEDEKYALTETLLYNSSEGAVTLNVIIDQENETLWATQETIANLFNVSVKNISKHLNNIFESGELVKDLVTFNLNNSTNSRIPLINPKATKQPLLYNLDAIISVGYRVNSKEATSFRIWATKTLKEYLIKGFVLDDELLKNGTRFGKDYFDELLERIREIRTSERRFNQKITDIYATSYDYKPKAEISREFFASVQNKLIYAVSGKTAAMIIAERANHEKPHMGLTTWKKPNGKILMSDVVISKNYFNKKELDSLNRIAEGFLNVAELRASRNIPTSMAEWREFLIDFIKLNQLPILVDKGNITSKMAKEIARKHYEKFKVIQDDTFESDFDRMIEEIKRIEGKTEK